MISNKVSIQELKSDLKEHLTEVENKLNEIEEAQKNQEKSSDSLNTSISDLHALKDDLILQFDQIDALETNDEVRFPELKKNIYNSLKSFDSAYTKAGALIEDEKFRVRNRNIDFKDPQNTL